MAVAVLESGDTEEIERFAELAVGPNAEGGTLLHEAAVGNHASLVAAIIRVLPQSALGVVDHRGRTAVVAAAACPRPLKRSKRVILQLLRAMTVEQICTSDCLGKNVAHYCARSVRGRASVEAFAALVEALPLQALTGVTARGDSVPACLFRVHHRHDGCLRDAAALLFQKVPHLVDCVDPQTGDSLLVKAAAGRHARCLQLLGSLVQESTVLLRNRSNRSLLNYLPGLLGPSGVMEDFAEALPVSLLATHLRGSPLMPLLLFYSPTTDILIRRTPYEVLEQDSKMSPEEYRVSLLYVACWKTRVSSIRLLTERLGPAAWAQMSQRGTPLHISLRSSVAPPALVEMWHEVLDEYPDDGFGMHHGNGASLLHIAVGNARVPLSIVDQLIERSPANLFSEQDAAGNCPLHCALVRGSLNVVATVLALTPPEVFMVANSSCQTPVTLALMCHSLEAAELTLHAAPYEALTFPCGPVDNTPLHYAVPRVARYMTKQTETLVRLAPHVLRATNKRGQQPWELLPLYRGTGRDELADLLTPRICVKSAHV